MSVVVITPSAPIVSLAEAKRQIRVEAGDDDAHIQALIAVATASIDGPTGWLGRALGEQELLLRGGCHGPAVALPYPPIVSILEAKVDGVVVDHSAYSPSDLAFRFPVPVGPSSTFSIQYRAGWPIEGGAWKGPATIKHAILMMVTRLWHHRGEDIPDTLAEDRAVRALLGPYWLMRP